MQISIAMKINTQTHTYIDTHTNLDRYIHCYVGSDTCGAWLINNNPLIKYLGANPMILKMIKLKLKDHQSREPLSWGHERLPNLIIDLERLLGKIHGGCWPGNLCMTVLTRKIQSEISIPGRPHVKANQQVAKRKASQEPSYRGSSMCSFCLGTDRADW